MSLDSDLSAGFQVKYLGSVSFVRKKRQPLKGIVSLQRPLLELYTGARRRGESHRSVHPLALTQQLEVCDYGLVVAEGTNRGETVVTKVITPLSNVVLWASVRFHARIIKKRVFGAAFVPLACSDGVLDHKSYVCLASKQRFLVSLTHPSIFACIYRSVSSPTTFECHAFVCATAEDALAVAAYATAASKQGESGRRMYSGLPPPPRRRIAASVDSGTDYYSPSDNNEERMYEYRESIVTRTDTEEESNSYASVVNKNHSPSVGRRRFVLGANSPRHRSQKRFLHHREARALIGKCREPPRPLPPEEVRWEANPQRRKEAHDEQQRSTSSYDRDDPVPSDNPTVEESEPRFRNSSTMTEQGQGRQDQDQVQHPSVPKRTEVLAETIDLSSETASSLGSSSVGGGGWRPVLPATEQQPPPLVKYTYFGYETYARPTSEEVPVRRIAAEKHQHTAADGKKKSMGEQRRSNSRTSSNGTTVGTKGGVIQGNGTGKVTINVPYRPSSRTSSTSSRTVPHGVRSFHKSGHVRNWSSLSQTSASSSSSTYRGTTTLPPPAARSSAASKVIRWSSDDRLPRRQGGGGGGFFWSLKRIGMQSLTKAKHKTGKFISSMKTRIMGPKRSSADGSEDSAYDTSEVCLSPSGRQGSSSPTRQPAPKSAARRQQSWSFHDLRTAAVERPTVRRNHNLAHRRKHRRRRKAGRSSSSSDSGVEAAYHSDNSARKSNSELGRAPGVTRVKVQHGMGTDTFQRWSHTNLQDELGYIP